MHRLLLSREIQAKLAVGPVDDEYEREADAMSRSVMRMPEPADAGLRGAPLSIQRRCKECEEEVQRQPAGPEVGSDRVIGTLLSDDDTIQRVPSSDDPVAVDRILEGRVHALRGQGRPLPASEQQFMEARFGYDFGRVRIHTGAGTNDLAGALNARAFTVGNDVVFGAGQYRPGTPAGRTLLAHELTHVVQQTPARSPTIQRQPTPPISQAEENRLSLTTPGRATVQFTPPALSLFNFGHDRAEPKAFHRELLVELATLLREEFPNASFRIRVVGHASSPGSIEHNQALSERRATAVANILRSEGVSRVDVSARGELEPAGDNNTVEGRARNRRVDLLISALPGPQPQPPCPNPPCPEPQPCPNPPCPEPPDPVPPCPNPPCPPPPPPPPPPPDRSLCERFPILCSLLPIPLPFLPFLVCVIAPELCALIPCLLNPLACVPPVPPVPPQPPQPPRPPQPPPTVIFGRVRASNTPAPMGDRIPDQGSTFVFVFVAGLDPSAGPLVISPVGNGIRNGDFLIDGGASTTITASTILEISGTTQTSELAGAFNLHLEATLAGARVALSRPFAVSAIMEDMKTKKSGEIVDPTGAMLLVEMSWDSDGANDLASLSLMEYVEKLSVLREEGGLVGAGLGQHGNLLLADRPQIDQHGTNARFMQSEGRQEIQQVHTLVDHRTGSLGEDIPVTNSGFLITRIVEPDPGRAGCLRFVITKAGQSGTGNGFFSGAGSGSAELIVPLPCGGGGGGGGTTPTTPTVPTPHLGPVPSGSTPFGLVSGVPCDPAIGRPLFLTIFFRATTVNRQPPESRLFTTTIPCQVVDVTPTHVILVTLNPVPLSLAPSGFELVVLTPDKRIEVPRRLVCGRGR